MMQLKYIVRSEINKRQNNEDSFQIFSLSTAPGLSPIFVLGVADGMGGLAHGEQVSREVLKKVSLSLCEELTIEPSINCLESVPPLDIKRLSQALMNAIEQANAHVRRMVEINKWGNAGSTIVVAAILADTAVVANLGDSPLFHYQVSSGKLTQVTEDHSLAGVLLRAEMITPEMALYHEGRSMLEFYVGCPQLPQDAPVYELQLSDGDLLLLCSDGISASLLQEQIAQTIAESNNNLESIADNLIVASNSAGETDNQTLILWQHHKADGTKQLSEFKTVIQGLKTTRQMLSEN